MKMHPPNSDFFFPPPFPSTHPLSTDFLPQFLSISLPLRYFCGGQYMTWAAETQPPIPLQEFLSLSLSLSLIQHGRLISYPHASFCCICSFLSLFIFISSLSSLSLPSSLSITPFLSISFCFIPPYSFLFCFSLMLSLLCFVMSSCIDFILSPSLFLRDIIYFHLPIYCLVLYCLSFSIVIYSHTFSLSLPLCLFSLSFCLSLPFFLSFFLLFHVHFFLFMTISDSVPFFIISIHFPLSLSFNYCVVFPAPSCFFFLLSLFFPVLFIVCPICFHCYIFSAEAYFFLSFLNFSFSILS
ncbi:unnamed protein product [Acanthosepion pharaonis]|uniref:Uncharacterized protein n=1 Tax=Acanthosepion pharaonis TaxID=158019 RepID=A0A812DHU7_ACAPH|nr:unnamed protein product [Sepia pharaonis]